MTSEEFLHDGPRSEKLLTAEAKVSRNLSRSPHPYHRRSTSLRTVPDGTGQTPLKYDESSESTESEERGTEADDEKGPILKGLPAPPLRGHKGLKGSRTPTDPTPAASPFPTPPIATSVTSSYFPIGKSRKNTRLENAVNKSVAEAYEKYVRRRRAEIARRGTETGLLALIGIVACKDAFLTRRLHEWSGQLYSSVAVAGLLCVLYPLRLALHQSRRGFSFTRALRAGFHIPSRFDLGALLYPTLVPLFISASLSHVDSQLVATNLVLGLCSLPPGLIPLGTSPLASYIHWAVTLAPVLAARPYGKALHDALPIANLRKEALWALETEELAVLFLLHQAVLTTLKYLTSTSLDPAEIQLLATGLVNLNFFAASPQSQILKGLLWVGALSIFVACQKPLSWEVAIARIPTWKFARNRSPKTGFLGLFENVANLLLPRHPYKQSGYLSPDDEDYEHLKSARKMVKTQMRLRRIRSTGVHSDLDSLPQHPVKRPGNDIKTGLQRSVTMSTNQVSSASPVRRRALLLNTAPTGFLSLTYTQAQACKWFISAYVFSAVACIILFVVRRYVSERALSSYEPFGWAIGYLLGNIPWLRLWIVTNNLERWIRLPRHAMQDISIGDRGWVERARQLKFGPANARLAVMAYCVFILSAGIGTVLRLGAIVEVDTRRKVFHGIMVAMLLPTIFVDPCFIALALSLILAIFLLLDLFRASQLPPVSKPLTTFLAPYVDGRDYRGPIIVSPIFLLIGCAIPLWLSLAAVPRTGADPWTGWDTTGRDLGMISGVVCVGMGDAAASLIGRRYGKTKWFWGGGKSLEGSFAFAVAVMIGLSACHAWLRIGGWAEFNARALPVAFVKTAIAGAGVSMLESVLTAGNDNVIVPVGLWLLVRGLQI